MKLSESLKSEDIIFTSLREMKPVHILESIKKLKLKHDIIDNDKDNEDLIERLKEFEKRLEDRHWKGVYWRDVSSLAQALFKSPEAHKSDWKKVRNFFLEILEKTDEQSFIKSCFDGYVMGFSEDSKLTNVLAGCFRKNKARSVKSIEEFAEDFSVFDPVGLPRRIAQKLNEEENPYAVARSFEITSPDMPGLFSKVFQELLDIFESDLNQQDINTFKKITSWVNPEPEKIINQVRVEAVEAMLGPFINNPPRDGLKDYLLKFLLTNFGDPRTRTDFWPAIEEKFRKVLFRWLAGETIKDFFDIMSYTEDSEMWPSRKEFWTELYDEGWIEDAWPILNKVGAQRANNIAKDTDKLTFKQHGKISNAGDDPKSYFVLKVKNCTVVEGTHSFAMRIFDRNNEFAPQLYNEDYQTHQFKRYTERVIHKPDDSRRVWQNEAMRVLNRLGR